MAIIPLRQYNREIEGLIDTGKLDEAVAHCRHILESFPKHLATYRLLGKAYLEQQRFGDAADIFQRVLSSIPDDHVANIGMSIIREDEGNLDAAIWYMERALEAQPSNSAIKDELRRLYGRRDGIEPPKIRLTRGALARMYSRGGLYDQAISELRAALADDPQRPDLLVLLAQMYFHLGQQVEAVDSCGNLVKRLPYCLVANRILASILPQTGRADDTKTYQQRVIAMDPYFASAPQNALSSDSVPESAINIERLAYRPGQASGPVQPAWAASLGIALEDTQGEQLPEWLQDQSGAESIKKDAQPVSPVPFSWETEKEEATPTEEPTSVEDIIPDWMKDAGWQPAMGTAAEDKGIFDLEPATDQPEGEIVKADIPDWLKELAPSGALDEEPSPELSDQGELDLPWLQKTVPGASDTIVNWLGAQKPIDETESAKQADPVLPQEPTDTFIDSPLGQNGDENGLPDWLQGVEDSYGKSGITDWLKEMGEPAAELAPIEPTVKEPALPAEELPDWLKEMGEPAADLTPLEPVAEEYVLPAEEFPDWLKEMGEPVAELTPLEPVAEEPALPAEEFPNWLKEMGEPAAELAPLEPVAEVPALPAEELPDWLKEMAEPAAELAPLEPVAEESALPADELPDWLKEMGEPAAELAPLEPVAEVPAAEEPIAPFEDVPSWLKETAELAASAAAISAEEPAGEEPTLPEIELPDWLLELGQSESTGLEAGDAEAFPTDAGPYWLRDTAELAHKVAEPAEPAAEEPALPAEELPDWLKVMGEPAAELTLIEPAAEEPALPAEELPDWLKEIKEPATEEPAAFIDQSDQDTALAWLEALAAQQGAKEDELITSPEKRLETMPDWIKIEAEELELKEEIPTPAEISEEPAVPTGELPDWLKEIAGPDASLVTAEPTAQESALPAEELPDWLKEVAEPTAELPPAPAGPEAAPAFLDQSDQDAALAWLESLAAQHGAIEEELITKPEDRLDTMPDWVKLEAAEAQHEAAVAQEPAPAEEPALPAEELPDWLKEIAEPAAELAPEATITAEPVLPIEELALPAEELPDWLKGMAEPTAELAPTAPAQVEPSPSIDLSDQDAALAWLEGLAAQHGASEEELITRPEERLEAMPDWIKQGAESSIAGEEIPTQPVPVEQPTPSETEIGVPVLPLEELPDWLSETVAPAEASQLPEVQSEIEQLPDWLQDTAAPQAERTGEQLAEDIEALPDWLKEVEPTLPGEVDSLPAAEHPTAPVWMPEAILPGTEAAPSQEPVAPVSGEIEPTLPEIGAEPVSGGLQTEAVNINTASLSQLEHLQGIGFVAAQNIVAFRDANGPFSAIEDLAQIPGVEPALIEGLRTQLTTGIPELAAEPEPIVETEQTIFTSARHAVEQGNVSLASDLYNQLIKQGADLDQVIADMQTALYRYPVDINFWQILGDAYLRTDKLQEALDAYTEAEELLR